MNYLTATLVVIWSFVGAGYVVLDDGATFFQKIVIFGIAIALSIVVDIQGFIGRLKMTFVPTKRKDGE